MRVVRYRTYYTPNKIYHGSASQTGQTILYVLANHVEMQEMFTNNNYELRAYLLVVLLSYVLL